jgi:hypothetical protein
MTKVVSPSGAGVLIKPVSLVIGPLAYNTTMNLEAMLMSMISNNLDLAVSLLERIGFSEVSFLNYSINLYNIISHNTI